MASNLEMTWCNVRYSVENGQKEILKGLSGRALPGRALAILGSSGAGKTTFLNCLSDRIAKSGTDVKYEGTVELGGVPYEHAYRKLIGFVTQDDILSSTSTPDEALRFTVRTRCDVTDAEATTRVDAMIDTLALNASRSTIVGVPGLVTGLSGGERKRCNIGTELIANPVVLLLDEPTSGLDSITALKIVTILNHLASDEGRTVVFTIHQPTAACLAQFDDLMLMCQGCVVYHGPMAGAVDYFASVGYNCPATHTPSDYFMTLLQDEPIGLRLIDLWAQTIADLNAEVAKPFVQYVTSHAVASHAMSSAASTRVKPMLDGAAALSSSMAVQGSELFARSFKNIMRNRMYVGAIIGQNVFFGIFAGLIYIRLEDGITGLQDRAGLLFMLASNIGFGSVMSAVNTFPSERAVFVREQKAAAYSPFIYLLAKSLSELPLQIISVLLTSVIIYFLTGLVISGQAFFTFFAILLASQQAGVGIGLALSAMIENYMVVTGVTPMILVPMVVTGGLLGSTDRLRPYWYWLEKVSIVRYPYILLMKNELERIATMTCDVAKFGAAFCSRQPKTGEQALVTMGLSGDEDQAWIMWVCLGLMIVVTRTIATIALWRVARSNQ